MDLAVIDDYIKYFIPQLSEVLFNIPQERKVYATLIDGNAVVVKDGTLCALPSMARYELWKSEKLVLRAKSDCTLIVRGNHCVCNAFLKIHEIPENLFSVSRTEKSYIFVIDKGIQLHISVGKQNTSVKLTPLFGEPAIFGCPLPVNKEYILPPESSVLVNSFSDEHFTLEIQGRNRRINVLALKEKTTQLMKDAHLNVEVLREEARLHSKKGPAILVTGPSNVGKTSFCHYLINKAVEKEWTPVYIDLDVRRNSITVPGAVSASKVERQCDPCDTFPCISKKLLYFGSTNPHSNIHLYFLLIRMLGMHLLSLDSTDSSVQHSGIIVDICGCLGEYYEYISYILKQFHILYVFVLGNEKYFSTLKETLSEYPGTLHFIPCSKVIEKRSESKEKRIFSNSLRKFFYGTVENPIKINHFKINLSDITIYSTVFIQTDEPDQDVVIVSDKVRFWHVKCLHNIKDKVLGVSAAQNVCPFRQVTEIKHFVYVTQVDIEKNNFTLISPEAEPLINGILLMGEIKLEKRSPRH